MEQSKFYQIKNITEHEYTLVGCDGSVITRPIQDVDKSASAFTIQDAKDGDVLYSLDSNRPFIYKERNGYEQAKVYCGINIYGKFFVGNTKDCIITTDKYIPATKEQRDALMKAMADAGYTFDFEKKELKKIEQKPADTKKGTKGNEREIPIPEPPLTIKHAREVMGIEQNPAWSEEDESWFKEIELMCLNFSNDTDYREKFSTWLKSLKDKVQQPKQEWSEKDKGNLLDVKCIIDEVWHSQYAREEIEHSGEELESLWHWLDKLWQRVEYPQNTWNPSDEHYELEEFAKIVRGNLTGISKAVQELFEAKYLQLTGNKMYGGFKD